MLQRLKAAAARDRASPRSPVSDRVEYRLQWRERHPDFSADYHPVPLRRLTADKQSRQRGDSAIAERPTERFI